MTSEHTPLSLGAEYAAARQTGDRDALLRLLTPDFSFQDPAYAHGHARRDAFIELIAEHARALVDPEYTRIGPMLCDESGREISMRWVCRAEVEVEGERRKVAFETAEFCSIRGGRVCRTTVFTRDLLRASPLDGQEATQRK